MYLKCVFKRSNSLSMLLVVVLMVAVCAAAPGAPSQKFHTVAPGVEVFPAPGELLDNGQAIVVRLTTDPALQGRAPLRVFMDNREITSEVKHQGVMLTIPVPETLAGGLHSVRLEIPSLLKDAQPVTWSFQVSAPAEGDLHDAAVVVHDNAPHVLYESDTLEVTAEGPSGGKATARIDGSIVFPLTEGAPGHYSGSYEVHRTDYLIGAPVRVRIALPNGQVVGNHSGHIVKMFGQMFTIRVTSPENGSVVGFAFTMKGHTRPFAHVSISPTMGNQEGFGYSSSGQAPIPGRVHRGWGGYDVTADEHGYFELKFGFPVHLVDLAYTFTLTAIDRHGQQAIPTSFYVKMSANPSKFKAKSADSPGTRPKAGNSGSSNY